MTDMTALGGHGLWELTKPLMGSKYWPNGLKTDGHGWWALADVPARATNVHPQIAALIWQGHLVGQLLPDIEDLGEGGFCIWCGLEDGVYGDTLLAALVSAALAVAAKEGE